MKNTYYSVSIVKVIRVLFVLGLLYLPASLHAKAKIQSPSTPVDVSLQCSYKQNIDGNKNPSQKKLAKISFSIFDKSANNIFCDLALGYDFTNRNN